MQPWPQILTCLERKYATLLDLRRQRQTLEQQGILRFAGQAGQDRRDLSQALAQEFPGILRELDVLGAAALEKRLMAVRYELRMGRTALEAPLWLRAMVDFHAHWAEVLAVKGFFRSAKPPLDVALEEDFLRWFAHCPQRVTELSGVSRPWLHELLQPPQGRLAAVVWQRLAKHYELSPEALRALIFEA